MCPGPRLTTAEAWIEYLESDQHKNTVANHQFFQNQNASLDFRENLDKIDKEKLNIQKVY